jgi:hypothetical protein
LCSVSLLLPALVVMAPATASAAPGGHTAAQVNAAVAAGVAHIDSLQNPDGSFGSGGSLWAETGYSLVAYSVLQNGSFANLSASYQAHVKKAITFLLTTQDAGTTMDKGSWSPSSGGDFKTYNTGSDLAGLSFFTGVDPGVPGAIAAGRAYLISTFQAPPHFTCTTTPSDPTATVCGGWNYESFAGGHSDASNTGFAMTGLQLTGGIPDPIKPVNIGWQNNIQALSTNPFSTRNDGGAGYEPGCASDCGSFSSNANDTGSMLFGLADDGVTAADPKAAAGIKFGNDVINEYLLEQTAGMHTMVFHTGTAEDGTCVIGGACDWFRGTGEGGYHYSLFALAKGLGSFITPNLTDATNWYAKIVDLLLNQQGTDGSWPPDLRDDGTALFATALAVSALGLVAVPPSTTPCTPAPTDARHIVTGSVPGTLNLSGGSWSVTKASVGGTILVGAGTTAVIGDSTVRGAVLAGSGAKVAVCRSSVAGSLTATSHPAGVSVCASTIGGAITVSGSTKFVLIGDPTDDTCGANRLTSAGGNSLTGNTGGIEVVSNTINGSLTFSSNSGKGPFAEDTGPEIEGNHFGGSLNCSANVPAPINDGKPNTVGGARTGQCSGSF